MLAIIIKDYQLCLNNKNFLFRKSTIQVEPYIQKKEKDKYFVFFFQLQLGNMNWFRVYA